MLHEVTVDQQTSAIWLMVNYPGIYNTLCRDHRHRGRASHFPIPPARSARGNNNLNNGKEGGWRSEREGKRRGLERRRQGAGRQGRRMETQADYLTRLASTLTSYVLTFSCRPVLRPRPASPQPGSSAAPAPYYTAQLSPTRSIIYNLPNYVCTK